MTRQWFLPGLMVVFALISLLTLKSVAPSLVNRQLLYFIVGAGIFIGTSKISFIRWVQFSPAFYALLIGFLLLTKVIGTVTRGTISWIPLGSFHIQPSQMAVPIVALLVSRMIIRKPLHSVGRILQVGVCVAVPALLIFLEPDLGTAAIYAVSLAIAFWFGETPLKFIGMGVFLAVVLAIFSWNFVLQPYQKQRILGFMDLQEQGSGQYNAIQSMIAVGSGEVFGRGLGEGVQSHLRFLPERQTDFIFASFAEETGFIGASLVLLLYLTLICFLLWLSWSSVRWSEALFAAVTAMMITTQAGIHLGMNMGILPITGITLPFISYGGSSILAFSFQFGVIQSFLQSWRPKAALEIK